jgi:hypothetical protein
MINLPLALERKEDCGTSQTAPASGTLRRAQVRWAAGRCDWTPRLRDQMKPGTPTGALSFPSSAFRPGTGESSTSTSTFVPESVVFHFFYSFDHQCTTKEAHLDGDSSISIVPLLASRLIKRYCALPRVRHQQLAAIDSLPYRTYSMRTTRPCRLPPRKRVPRSNNHRTRRTSSEIVHCALSKPNKVQHRRCG